LVGERIPDAEEILAEVTNALTRIIREALPVVFGRPSWC
jgi:hypothetical protein